jgi:hypothetical protein
MGGFTPGLGAVLPGLGQAVGIASGLQGLAKQATGNNLAVNQLQAQQAESLRRTQEDTALRKAEIAASSEITERNRKLALRRAVARQRTQFGSQGISTNGGSGEAILLGLFDESENDRSDRERLDGIRTSVLNQNVAQQQRLKLLQSSQLKEKQRFSNLFG